MCQEDPTKKGGSAVLDWHDTYNEWHSNRALQVSLGGRVIVSGQRAGCAGAELSVSRRRPAEDLRCLLVPGPAQCHRPTQLAPPVQHQHQRPTPYDGPLQQHPGPRVYVCKYSPDKKCLQPVTVLLNEAQATVYVCKFNLTISVHSLSQSFWTKSRLQCMSVSSALTPRFVT